ncbi:MAG: hypothetical protein HY329_02855 [Chloroflexi bacterium]|nr:hypothetical protein [Chloroflexota bacterium]
MRRLFVGASLLTLLAGCGGQSSGLPAEAEAVRKKYADYTVERAEREGFKRDKFCLDALSLGYPPDKGAMGYHATDETRLRGPIEADRPQALLFDTAGKALGVEYEIHADAAKEPPRLFGQTFTKLPPHPGVEHEHYALHVWFVENPVGQFADLNPKVSCPPSETPAFQAPPAGGPSHSGGH